jgi:hypothetical protein
MRSVAEAGNSDAGGVTVSLGQIPTIARAFSHFAQTAGRAIFAHFQHSSQIF